MATCNQEYFWSPKSVQLSQFVQYFFRETQLISNSWSCVRLEAEGADGEGEEEEMFEDAEDPEEDEEEQFWPENLCFQKYEGKY